MLCVLCNSTFAHCGLCGCWTSSVMSAFLQAAQKKLLQRERCSSFSQHGMHSILCLYLKSNVVEMWEAVYWRFCSVSRAVQKTKSLDAFRFLKRNHPKIWKVIRKDFVFCGKLKSPVNPKTLGRNMHSKRQQINGNENRLRCCECYSTFDASKHCSVKILLYYTFCFTSINMTSNFMFEH